MTQFSLWVNYPFNVWRTPQGNSKILPNYSVENAAQKKNTPSLHLQAPSTHTHAHLNSADLTPCAMPETQSLSPTSFLSFLLSFAAHSRFSSSYERETSPHVASAWRSLSVCLSAQGRENWDRGPVNTSG